MAALQNNFFITNLMEVLQRDPECSQPEACNVLESASAATACQPLSCPNHEGKVSRKNLKDGVCYTDQINLRVMKILLYFYKISY